MNYKNILITGGAGFVGSNLAIKLKNYYTDINITSLDNLKRRGSELNLSRLAQNSINFIHGDIRNPEDLNSIQHADLILECSAEPSVLASISSCQYSLNTNLLGTLNCLNLAKNLNSHLIFISTSRVYPVTEINQIKYKETNTRFEIINDQSITGVSQNGINEDFPLGKFRSLYGTTKLCSEFLIQEFAHNFNLKTVINRCGIITGPWQMGKVDQGVIVLWLARHIWKNKPLSYIGFGGKGKQVRDFIDIKDLFDVINLQINNINKYNQEIFNIGGGVDNNLSLLEMTNLCQKITKNKINITSSKEDRPDDIRIYISDTAKFQKISNWRCRKNKNQTFEEIYRWIIDNKNTLEKILN